MDDIRVMFKSVTYEVFSQNHRVTVIIDGEGSVSIFTGKGSQEFIFQHSKPEMVLAVAKLLEKVYTTSQDVKNSTGKYAFA